MFNVGTRVRRNPDKWEYGTQDCDDNGNQILGTVTHLIFTPARGTYGCEVKWDNGHSWSYYIESLLIVDNYKCKLGISCYYSAAHICYQKRKEDMSCYSEYEALDV